MDGLKAEEVLDRKFWSLTASSVYELTLRATGSVKAAEKAFADRVAADLAAGKTPE